MKTVLFFVLCGAAVAFGASSSQNGREIGINGLGEDLLEALGQIDEKEVAAAYANLIAKLPVLLTNYTEELAKIGLEAEAMTEITTFSAEVTERVTAILEPLQKILLTFTPNPPKQIRAGPTIEEIIEAIETALNGKFDKTLPTVVRKVLEEFTTLNNEITAKIEEWTNKYDKFSEALALTEKMYTDALALLQPLLESVKPVLDVIEKAFQDNSSPMLSSGSFLLLATAFLSRYFY